MLLTLKKKIVEKNGINYKNFTKKCIKLAEKDELDTYDKNKYWMSYYETLGEIVPKQEEYIEKLKIDNPKNCIVKGKFYVSQKKYQKAISILQSGI